MRNEYCFNELKPEYDGTREILSETGETTLQC